MATIEFGSYQKFGRQSLDEVSTKIAQEQSMLPASPEVLMDIYQKGRAVLMMSDEQVVGYIKFAELLGKQLKNQVGIPQNVADIWEIGSAIIFPEFRGHNLFRDLRGALLESQLERMQNGELLVLGTTKRLKVMHSLHWAQSIGISFHPSNHQEFPMIAPFTCVCNEPMGTGYHHNTDGCFNCTSRISPSEITLFRDINNIPMSHNRNGDTIPCTMYVSSKELAQKTNGQLIEAFSQAYDPVAVLVQRLRGNNINYYEESYE